MWRMRSCVCAPGPTEALRKARMSVQSMPPETPRSDPAMVRSSHNHGDASIAGPAARSYRGLRTNREDIMFKSLRAACCLALGAAGSLVAPAAAQEFQFSIHHFFPPQAPAQTLLLEPWARSVEEASGGRIAFEDLSRDVARRRSSRALRAGSRRRRRSGLDASGLHPRRLSPSRGVRAARRSRRRRACDEPRDPGRDG